MMKLINRIVKYPDCPNCGKELEYQCFECEKEEERLNFFNILEECLGEALDND